MAALRTNDGVACVDVHELAVLGTNRVLNGREMQACSDLRQDDERRNESRQHV